MMLNERCSYYEHRIVGDSQMVTRELIAIVGGLSQVTNSLQTVSHHAPAPQRATIYNLPNSCSIYTQFVNLFLHLDRSRFRLNYLVQTGLNVRFMGFLPVQLLLRVTGALH